MTNLNVTYKTIKPGKYVNKNLWNQGLVKGLQDLTFKCNKQKYNFDKLDYIKIKNL